MLKSDYRWWTITSFMVVMLLATGCFRAGIDEAQPNAIAARVTETPTDIPTDVPTEAESATPSDLLALNRPTDTDTPTPTPTDTATPTPTNTDTPTATSTDEATLVPLETETPTEVLVAQALVTNTPDNFQLSATVYIREITQTAEAPLTLTAQFIQIPSDTPFPTASPTFAFPTNNNNNNTQPGGSTTGQGGVNLGVNCEHQVRAGENLFRISLYYGVPIVDIQNLNPQIVNPNLIRFADKLIIPNCGNTGGLPPPTFTPSPTQVGVVGQPTVVTNPITCGATYTIQQGDTLYRISQACNIPVLQIQYLNGITIPSLIYIGQEIRLQ